MDFVSMAEMLFVADLSAEQCRNILDSVSTEQLEFQPPVPNNGTLLDALNSLMAMKRTQVDLAVDTQNSMDMQRIAVSLLCTLSAADDCNLRLSAIRMLLELCSISGSSAYGVCNTNLLSSISSALLKTAHEQVRVSSSKGVAQRGPSKRSRSSQDEDDLDIAGMDTESPCPRENDTDEESDGENGTDADLEGMFGKRPNAESKKTVVPMQGLALKAVLQAVASHLDLFWRRSEEFPVECLAEALSGIACLAQARAGGVEGSQFTACLKLACEILQSLATTSVSAIMAVYRAMMPALTTIGRDPRFPDGFKGRNACHRVCVTVLADLCLRVDDIAAHFETLTTVDDSPIPEAPVPVVNSGNSPFSVPYSCIIGALQRMTIAMQSSTAPVRTLVLGSVSDILERLHSQMQGPSACALYFSFLGKLSRSENVNLRAYSLEISSNVVSKSYLWVAPIDTTFDEKSRYGGPRVLVEIILTRCDDVSPTVRLRGLSALCDLLEVLDENSPAPLIDTFFRFAMGDVIKTVKTPNTPMRSDSSKNPTPSKIVNKTISIIDLLRIRCYDEKPMVRAKAVQAFGQALSMQWPKNSDGSCTMVTMLITEEDITAMVDSCMDSSISVRKQSVSALTTLLLARRATPALMDAWLIGVLPLAADTEASVQLKTAQCCYDMFFTPLGQWADSKGEGLQVNYDHPIWAISCNIAQTPMRAKLLKSSVSVMIKQNILAKDSTYPSAVFSAKKIMLAIKKACALASTGSPISALEQQIVSAGWLLLDSILTQQIPGSLLKDLSNYLTAGSGATDASDFIVKCWTERTKSFALNENDIRILNVLEKMSSEVSLVSADRISNDLFKLLSSFQLSPLAISSSLSVLHALSSTKKDSFLRTLTELALNSLSQFVWKTQMHTENSTVLKDSETVASVLFLIGELSMLGFSIEEDGTDKSISSIVTEKVVNLVQTLMSKTFPTTDGELQEISCNIRAHAFVTMGKFCLRNKMLARSHINVYLRELHATKNADDDLTEMNPVKSNALLVLGDLCVRYTNLVDRHIGSLAACLQDSDALVRRHSLVLLTQLLLQDFLKWRGMLLFRFLATTVDADIELSELAKNILRKTLTTKFPVDMYCSHFAESVLVFNKCTDHPLYAAVASACDDGVSSVDMSGVNVCGNSNRGKRMRVYAFMMETFTEEQKIQTTAKLVHEILAQALDAAKFSAQRVVDGELSSFEAAVQDTLCILQSPLLKVGRVSNAQESEMGEEPDSLAEEAEKRNAAIQNAKTKVLKKLSKQHMIDQVLPIICSLKHTLEASRSSLQRPLMEYLIYLVKSNKQEVDTMLSSDPALKAEIEYDLKNYMREKAAKQAQKTVHNITASEHKRRQSLTDSGQRRKSIGTPKMSAVKVKSASGRSVLKSISRDNLEENEDGNDYQLFNRIATHTVTPHKKLMSQEEVLLKVDGPTVETDRVDEAPPRRWSVSIRDVPDNSILDDEDSKLSDEITFKKDSSVTPGRKRTKNSRGSEDMSRTILSSFDENNATILNSNIEANGAKRSTRGATTKNSLINLGK